MARLCPVGTEIQTLIFPAALFDAEKARAWALAHDFSAAKVHTTGQSHRIRQKLPSRFKTGSFRTIELGVGGVQAIIGCPLAPKKRGQTSAKSPTLEQAMLTRRLRRFVR